MIGKGFERLFEIVDEIEIDAPLARSILSSFLARAVIDEVLPPSFLADSVICNLGGEIVDHAKVMLSVEHAGAKLEKIWGPGDGRPVEELKVAVDQILMEYILSMDLEEVIRCLNELHAPQFFHEIVKRAVVLVLDKPEQQRKAISELFAQLAEIQLMTITQAEKGFNRLYYSLPDLILDSPNAGKILDELTATAISEKVLSSTYKKPEKQEKNA
jgi:programmed cell death protein 4